MRAGPSLAWHRNNPRRHDYPAVDLGRPVHPEHAPRVAKVRLAGKWSIRLHHTAHIPAADIIW
eukprot:617486-Alexandrium_andersonii.AAC.1